MVNGLYKGMSTGYPVGYSQVSSQGTALKQHPAKSVQEEVELYRWHNLAHYLLPAKAFRRTDEEVMLLGVKLRIFTLHSVHLSKDLRGI